ncbi:glucokinase [Reichenbachiella sp. 5M10]|uniref:ROK family protein n=1 Tax=Reichenbachiella sp. 5M10 TaxID=1889772 RepID=UPI000C1486F6|nr:ROK family protein [Reichenbachiella sp. 5M10]PIB34663.1 glucokinase [Reichenbachiella sp. 5M10]
MIKVTAGIDIGGTGTQFGLVDPDGQVLTEGKVDTRGTHSFEEFIDKIAAFLRQHLVENPGLELTGIGVGAPSGNYYTGTITDAPNLPWKGTLDVVQLLNDRFHVPVVLSNDANATAMGEKVFGAAKDIKDFVMITLGTGLGSGIVSSQQLVIGSQSMAAEFGHVMVRDKGGRLCNCGRRGCLETYVSATGIKRTLTSLLAKHPCASALRSVSFDDLTSKDIAHAARSGDVLAKKAFQKTGRVLGKNLANLVAIMNPEAIFLFGGLAQAGDLIFNPTRRALEENLLDMYKGKVQVLPSALGSQGAAILGAASLAHQQKDYLHYELS